MSRILGKYHIDHDYYAHQHHRSLIYFLNSNLLIYSRSRGVCLSTCSSNNICSNMTAFHVHKLFGLVVQSHQFAIIFCTS